MELVAIVSVLLAMELVDIVSVLLAIWSMHASLLISLCSAMENACELVCHLP